jgi:hypothetical protein
MGTRIEAIKNHEIIDTNFYEYWNQCRMLNYASKGNYQLFLESMKPPFSTERELKQGGYFNASLLLRAVAIENLIKSRILFLLDKLDLLSQYKTIGEVVKKEWKGISHNPLKLCEKYKIELKNNEIILIKNHLDHMDWAGRFPFPLNINQIKSEQILGGSNDKEMDKLISRFANEMGLDINLL